MAKYYYNKKKKSYAVTTNFELKNEDYEEISEKKYQADIKKLENKNEEKEGN